ncbi:Cob(I)yrinic acid a,c-diamide adenosyltransferase [compost metagenome]
MAVCNYELIEEAVVLDFLAGRPQGLEVVLTGRNPSEKLIDMADYVSEIKKVKHPYDRGIHARQGIEY